MRKIILSDYYGMCDSNGNLVGHPGKVALEYADILRDSFDLIHMASPCVIKQTGVMGVSEQYKLKYDIQVDQEFTLVNRVHDKIKILRNIREIFREAKRRKIRDIFFYQVDFFFFFYIFFHSVKNHRVFILLYQQNFVTGRIERILQLFYRAGLKKVSGVLYTQEGLCPKHENAVWIPDYSFDEAVYRDYQFVEKADKVVCLGTMNRYKQIEELVDLFRDRDMPLEITGRFDSKQRYNKIIDSLGKDDNIIISDSILSVKEYYKKLSEAKYCFLPYDMDQYTNRTSGVLIESIFCGCIPVAPKKLLEQNGLPGIGYNSIKDALTEINKAKTKDWKNEFEKVYLRYDKKSTEDKMKSLFRE